jgi:hypothetical protein
VVNLDQVLNCKAFSEEAVSPGCEAEDRKVVIFIVFFCPLQLSAFFAFEVKILTSLLCVF